MGMYKNDQETTVAELDKIVNDFMIPRNWHIGRTPKNLAMSIAIEAAEIMEHFQWGAPEDYMELTEEKRHEVSLEVADVMIYLLSFCRATGIDLATAVQAKMEINEGRFPVEKFRNVRT